MADNGEHVSPLREAAIQTHELYTELRAAGFARGEAIELVAKTLSAMFIAGQSESD